MTIEEKVIKANVWSVQKDIKREIFEAAYQDWREKRDRLQRRKDTVMAIVFVVYMLIAGVIVSIVWGRRMSVFIVMDSTEKTGRASIIGVFKSLEKAKMTLGDYVLNAEVDRIEPIYVDIVEFEVEDE